MPSSIIMSLKTDILRQLKEREGERVSGQILAARFSVSRAAVWKAVSALKREGYAIEGAPKAGYRLLPSDVLSADEIKAALMDAGFSDVKIYVFSTLPSTNGYAERLLGEGLSSPAVVAADEQTEGRARRGGTFSSKRGGLYMSLLFFPDALPETSAKLARAVYEGVNAVLCGERRENEIFRGEKKLCGILTQFVTDPDRVKSCLAGIGVYVQLLSDDVKTKYPTRNELCAAIAQAVFETVKEALG